MARQFTYPVNFARSCSSLANVEAAHAAIPVNHRIGLHLYNVLSVSDSVVVGNIFHPNNPVLLISLVTYDPAQLGLHKIRFLIDEENTLQKVRVFFKLIQVVLAGGNTLSFHFVSKRGALGRLNMNKVGIMLLQA